LGNVNSALDSFDYYPDLALRLDTAAGSGILDTYSADHRHHYTCHLAYHRKTASIAKNQTFPFFLNRFILLLFGMVFVALRIPPPLI
jgi:hypothetical protein